MQRTFNLFSLGMILALMASLLGMPPIPAYAQSAIQNVPLSLPAGWSRGYLYDVWGSSPQDVYAVGHAVDTGGDPVPLLYHNDGSGWIEASPPLAAGWGGGGLYGVWGSSASDVYAVGEGYNQNGSGPLLYHNDGTGWIEATPSLPAGWSGGSLIDVWGSSASDIYAVGWSTGPLLYHNDGTGWTEVGSSLPMRGYLHGVWGSSASDVYVVGAGANKPVLYHNDGTSWTDVSPSLPAGWSGGRLEGVWGSSVTDVYAIGSGSNGPLLYHNDGSGWSGANLSLPDGWGSGSLYGVGGSSPDDVYAVGFGDEASGRVVPLLYHNDGIGWAEASPALPTGLRGGELYSVWGSSVGDLYIVGVGFTINGDSVPLLYQRGAANGTPVVRYVKWNASGANNGTSWTDAYTDLQSALTAASSGDEIWVAAGTYKPTTGIDRTVSFTLKNGVAIYGGFTGTETLRTQRDYATNGTILSGDIGLPGSSSDNSYHVMVGSGTNNSALLDGFTITGGNADNSSQSSRGGGMFNDLGDPTVANVIFTRNTAVFGGGMANDGDFSYWDGSSPVLTNVIFRDNAALEGGGMHNFNYSNPTLTNVLFINNTAIRSGGGMINFDYSSPTQTNVTFNGNTASVGGGIMNWVGNSSILTNVTFHNNSATTDWGGGMANYHSSPSLTNVTFSGNSAAIFGGGMSNESSSPTLTHVTFSGNTAGTYGGGIYNEYGSNATVTNSILYGNSGGGIYDVSGVAAVTNSIVQGGYPGTGNLDADPLLVPLQDNGGFTETMALGMGSPAIDAAEDPSCSASDQRGIARPQGSHCDIGAYEYDGPIAPTPTNTSTPTATQTPTNAPTNTPTATYTPTPTFTPTLAPTTTNTNTPTATPSNSHNPLYLSLTGNQTIGGVSSADEDILRFDGQTWSLFFDGSDVGVGSSDLFGFSIVDVDTILMSFSNAVTVNGLAVTPQDVVQFDVTSLGSTTAGTFSMYLDGSDVGLDTTAEKIDSVSLLPDGRVLISTTGNPSVSGVAGKDEDALAFTSNSLGDITSGSWAMYFDGSDVGLAETSGEDVDALDVAGGKLYLSTADNFSVNGVAGADEDVFICTPTALGDVTACNYSQLLYFDGSQWGLSANDVDAFNFLSLGPVPTPAYTSTPTSTPTVTQTPTPGSQILPDLTIISMSITLQNTSCYTPGDPYGVRVWVRNNGQTAAGSFVVNVNGATQTVNGLGVAETKAVFFAGASNPVTATVDSMNTVAESNENNNTRSEMVPVPTQPLPCPTPTFTPTYTATPTALFTPTFTNTPASSDLIFADVFESGNLSAWSSSSTDLGDLSISSAAALAGSQGLQAVIDDNNSMYLTDDGPNAEPRYRARFYFDPNSILMTSGDVHFIFRGFTGTSTDVLRLEIRNSSGAYQLRAAVINDSSAWTNSNWITISDASHFMELDWRAATAVGANNGGLTLWIDATQQADLMNVDNDTWRIDRIRLGALAGIDTGTRGTYYFDAFESRRQSYIGP